MATLTFGYRDTLEQLNQTVPLLEKVPRPFTALSSNACRKSTASPPHV